LNISKNISSDLGLASLLNRIILSELQADTVHAMPLIDRGCITFSFEDVAKMATTVAADNLSSLHAKGAIRVSRHCARDGIEICRPTAARLELVVCLVERRIAASAGVDTLLGHVLVIFSCSWSFGTLLSENPELFYDQESAPGRTAQSRGSRSTFIQHSLPLLIGSLVWIGHIGG